MIRFICHVSTVDRDFELLILFQTGHYDKVISTLQAQFKDNIGNVVDIVFAHTQYRWSFEVILALGQFYEWRFDSFPQTVEL